MTLGQKATRRQPLIEYKWIVLINTTIGILMASIDGSILTIALPDITRSLHASVVDVMWIVMGFQLVITSLLLPFSRLGDMKGRVRSYNLGFAVFTLASMLCGFSQTGPQLVGFRLIQGIGAALLFANSTALVTDAFPAWQRGVALGFNMMAGTTGFIAGTLLGGIIIEFFTWRYIFFINVPFGVFATIWAFLRLHEIGETDSKARFDVGGMITFPLAIGTVLAALTFVVQGRGEQPITYFLFAASGVLFVVFALIERRAPAPMMDFNLFRIRLFWSGNASLLLNSLARGSTTFILSWYFQNVLNNTPLVAGLKLAPMIGTMVIVAPVAGRLSDRFGSRWLSTIGLLWTLVAQLWMARFPVNVPYPLLAASLIMLGLGNGLFNSPNTSAVMGSVPANRRGIAAGMRTLLLNTGQTLAVALAMVILSTVMSYQVLTGLFTGSEGGVPGIDGRAFMQGFHEVFLFSAAISAVAIVCSSLRGTETRQGRPTGEAQERERLSVPATGQVAQSYVRQ
jgi:EmrB/QacA subfamily drug resistance transporter